MYHPGCDLHLDVGTELKWVEFYSLGPSVYLPFHANAVDTNSKCVNWHVDSNKIFRRRNRLGRYVMFY